MVYRGRVKNGKVVLDQDAALEEGQAVSVRPLRQRAALPSGKKSGSRDAQARVKAEEGWKSFVRASRRRLQRSSGKNGRIPTFYERYKDLIGTAKGLPSDFSTQLDHYLYGTPKRSQESSELREEKAASARAIRERVRAIAKKGPLPTLYERIKPAIGIISGLPSDFASQHDHYIHGTPKRK